MAANVCYDLHTEIDSRAKKTANELVTTGSLSSPVPRRLGIRDNVGKGCGQEDCGKKDGGTASHCYT